MKLGASVLLALALSSTACSSDPSSNGSAITSTSSPTTLSAADYVAGVCTALGDYQDSLQQAQSNFTVQTSDLAALKQSWLDLLDGMLTSTQQLVADIHALGAPDTSEGQQAADTIEGDFEQLQQDLQQLRDQSADLEPTDPGTFMSSFEPMISKFQTDMSTFGQDLEQFNGGELDQAFSQAPACAEFASSSSPSV
jgi:hypothetical protein